MLRGILIAAALLLGAGVALAETNIAAPTAEHAAWNDEVGWLDFYGTDTVIVQGTRVQGYASSSVGPVSFDCATSPNGNICGTSNYGVCNGLNATHEVDGTCSNGDASGSLIGYAWNDAVGWVSMSCRNHEAVGCATYQVTIDANGDFQGWAWNDIVGWVGMNCGNAGASCAPYAYKVNTAWRATSSLSLVDSVVIDSGATGGVALNSIVWQGTRPNGTTVTFQIATSSDPAGPWIFVGPGGNPTLSYGAPCAVSFIGGVSPTGADPDTPVCVDPNAAREMGVDVYFQKMSAEGRNRLCEIIQIETIDRLAVVPQPIGSVGAPAALAPS